MVLCRKILVGLGGRPDMGTRGPAIGLRTCLSSLTGHDLPISDNSQSEPGASSVSGISVGSIFTEFVDCPSSSQEYTSHIKAAVFCVTIVLTIYILNYLFTQQ